MDQGDEAGSRVFQHARPNHAQKHIPPTPPAVTQAPPDMRGAGPPWLRDGYAIEPQQKRRGEKPW